MNVPWTLHHTRTHTINLVPSIHSVIDGTYHHRIGIAAAVVIGDVTDGSFNWRGAEGVSTKKVGRNEAIAEVSNSRQYSREREYRGTHSDRSRE
jgi:hypothetical protein